MLVAQNSTLIPDNVPGRNLNCGLSEREKEMC